MTSPLALLGGVPLRGEPFPQYQTIGSEERNAAIEVLDSGVLSQFIGRDHPYFGGGPRIKQLQGAWAEMFGSKHAIAVNSATSGLYAAIGALDLEVGDEVLVSPYTMIASATCALVYNTIPVFVDIDPETYCMDPDDIERQITNRTKAIVVVHLFGCPAPMGRIMEIARKHGLKVIEDCAQSPLATIDGRETGTFGDIGIFSLNCHKTIQCGEGGICITDDDELALRLQLIRNHGEACVENMGYEKISNILGQNYRMGEIEAAIANEQLKKLPELTRGRQERAAYLSDKLASLDGIETPTTPEGSSHVYYLYVMRLLEEKVGITRDLFCKAVNAEGVQIFPGYVQPMYWEPLYQKRIAFGSKGFPWNSPYVDRDVTYPKGLCSVCEGVNENLFFTTLMYPPMTRDDLDDVVGAFAKVLSHAEDLRDHETK